MLIKIHKLIHSPRGDQKSQALDENGLRGEELLLNVICAIQNLSYYARGGGGESRRQNRLWMMRRDIAELLAPLLFHDNQELVFESVSAFGNLSGDPVGAEIFISYLLLFTFRLT